MQFPLLYSFLLSIFIGIMIGVQRERNIFKKEMLQSYGGIRTSILIALISSTLAYMSEIQGMIPWTIGLVAVTCFILADHIFELYSNQNEMISNKIEGIATYILASMPMFGFPEIGLALTLVLITISYLKNKIHQITDAMKETEFTAFLKFFLIMFLALPIVPNTYYDHYLDFLLIHGQNYDLIKGLLILNPYKILIILIVVSAISILGYLLTKMYGEKGAEISGFVGGIYSSGVTTLSIFTKSKERPEIIFPFVSSVIFALIAMIIRSTLEVSIFGETIFHNIYEQATVFVLILLGYIFWLNKEGAGQHLQTIEFKNPFTLRSSLLLTAYIEIALLASKILVAYLNPSWIFVIAFILGSIKIDPAIIAIASLSATVEISHQIIINAILIAWLANMLQKSIVCYYFGNKKIVKYLLFITAVLALIVYIESFLENVI